MSKLRFLSLVILISISTAAGAITKGQKVSSVGFLSQGPQHAIVGFVTTYKEREGAIKAWREYCGGAILNSKTILTATHCFPFKKLNQQRSIKIFLGSDASGPNIFESKVREENIFRHPLADLAIIKLSEELPSLAKTVLLPKGDIEYSLRAEAIILGYGVSKLDQWTASSSEWGTLKMAKTIVTEFQINQNEFPGLCKGDSGSPVLINRDSEFELLGIAGTVGVDLSPAQSGEFKFLGLQSFLERYPGLDFCSGKGFLIDVRPFIEWIESFLP